MNLKIQVFSLLFSFFYGILFSFCVNLNYQYLFFKKKIFRILMTFLFLLDMALLYFLAEEYYELMVIHPFREGNGRSVREFLREFVLSKKEQLPFNVELDFTKINPDEFLMAVKDKYLYPSLLQMLFKNALVKVDVKEDGSKHL